MPAEVAARLDAAIAAEAASAAAPPAPVPLLPAPRSSRGRTVTAALAGAAAVLVAASLAGTAGLTSSPLVDAAGEAGRSGPTSLAAPQGQASAGLDGALRVLVSGTAYRAGTLADQVSATLRAGTTAGAPSAAAADRDGTPAETDDRLAGCLESLTGRADAPLSLVDLASYEGRPAALLVVSEGPSVHTAWVVGRECDDDTPALITVRRISTVVIGSPTASPEAPAPTPSGP